MHSKEHCQNSSIVFETVLKQKKTKLESQQHLGIALVFECKVIKNGTQRVNESILPVGVLLIYNRFVVDSKNIIEYGFS